MKVLLQFKKLLFVIINLFWEESSQKFSGMYGTVNFIS